MTEREGTPQDFTDLLAQGPAKPDQTTDEEPTEPINEPGQRLLEQSAWARQRPRPSVTAR